jgi:hypothetical protein
VDTDLLSRLADAVDDGGLVVAFRVPVRLATRPMFHGFTDAEVAELCLRRVTSTPD